MVLCLNLIYDLIYQFFHSYMKRSSRSSLKKRSLDISLQHKNQASYTFSKKKLLHSAKNRASAERVNRTESKAVCLIGKPSLTSTLELLSLHIFHCYYFGHCSDELAACIPPTMAQPHSTSHLSTTILWNFSMQESISSVMLGFLHSTSSLQNSLPASVFLASLTILSFRRWVYQHLRGQMAYSFVSSYFPIYVLQCPFFSYFNNQF